MKPQDLSIKRKINVTLMGTPQPKINELEWVDGRIFANVWMTGTVVRIDPKSGVIDGLMDLTPLIPKNLSMDAVANGLAWDKVRRRLYVTGKLWPRVYELRLKRS
jgi:glutamine cyclotransferase